MNSNQQGIKTPTIERSPDNSGPSSPVPASTPTMPGGWITLGPTGFNEVPGAVNTFGYTPEMSFQPVVAPEQKQSSVFSPRGEITLDESTMSPEYRKRQAEKQVFELSSYLGEKVRVSNDYANELKRGLGITESSSLQHSERLLKTRITPQRKPEKDPQVGQALTKTGKKVLGGLGWILEMIGRGTVALIPSGADLIQENFLETPLKNSKPTTDADAQKRTANQQASVEAFVSSKNEYEAAKASTIQQGLREHGLEAEDQVGINVLRKIPNILFNLFKDGLHRLGLIEAAKAKVEMKQTQQEQVDSVKESEVVAPRVQFGEGKQYESAYGVTKLPG